MPRVDARTIERLYRQAGAERWNVPLPAFAAALERSLTHAPADAQRTPDRYLGSLRLEDLALACACEAGSEAAWEQFVREHRPLLYRAADALAPGGAARELADSLYADLYGLAERDGQRRSLFRYFHGRSSLGTWLRAVLAQRFVDTIRAGRRVDALPEDEPAIVSAVAADTDPDRPRYVAMLQQALGAAIGALAARDRLRLGLYYAQELTLAQTGRVLGEHEATVSRHLSRTRHVIRQQVEAELAGLGLQADEVDRCFQLATEDAGAMDLGRMLDAAGKNPELDRST